MADIIEILRGIQLFDKERDYTPKELNQTVARHRKEYLILGAYTDIACAAGKRRLITSGSEIEDYIQALRKGLCMVELRVGEQTYTIGVKKRKLDEISDAACAGNSLLAHSYFHKDPSGTKRRLVCVAQPTKKRLCDLVNINKGRHNILELEFISKRERPMMDLWYEFVREEGNESYTLRSFAASSEVRKYINQINVIK